MEGFISIKALLCQNSLILPFAFWTNMKLLHVWMSLSMPSGNIICFLCSISFRGSCKAYATLLGGTCYGQLPSLTCNVKVPSKRAFAWKIKSLNSLWNLLINISLAFLSATFLHQTWNKLACLFCHHTHLLSLSWSLGLHLFCNLSC